MSKYVKNNSGIQKTWLGKVLEDQEYYNIADNDTSIWANNSSVLVSVSSGDLLVAKDGSGTLDITDVAQAINYLKDAPSEVDTTGRPIVRYAATVKGWHYQAHSVQFEVNKLDSIYNKDVKGNDLGFSELKIYKANGDECTTQVSADVDGVKTIVTWKPTFDFEVISGNVRQLVKETVDSYIYLLAKIPTGYPAPNDWFEVPLVQGGVNLNYIGADEPLKTDGRASKLFKGTNGDHFEIVVNYDANLLNNENRHKMSIIFEIYKDPIS